MATARPSASLPLASAAGTPSSSAARASPTSAPVIPPTSRVVLQRGLAQIPLQEQREAIIELDARTLELDESVGSWSPTLAEGEQRMLDSLLLAEGEATKAVGSQRWEERRRKRPTQVEGQSGRKRRLGKRQAPPPTADGYPSCNLVGNGVLSCFPTSNTTLVQGEWSKFIWNANFPSFIGAGAVDIYLYHADSETIATTYLGIENSRRTIGIRPDDDWWPVNQTSWDSSRNETWPYFFVVVDANSTLTGGEVHQSTFSAIQTAAPATLVASLSSLSSHASASSASAALSSQSSASVASVSSASSSSRANAALQSGESDPSNGRGGGGLPNWAIAVIVVLSVLALVLAAVGAYFCMKAARRRRRAREVGGDGTSSAKGSEQPMMAGGAGAGTGAAEALLLGGGAAAGASAGAGARHSDATSRRPMSSSASDGTSEGPITHTDAAIMAEAFRKALRKPEFPSGDTTPSPGAEGLARAEEGSSDSGEYGFPKRESAILGGGGGAGELLEQEIRSEGRSLSSVPGGQRWGQQG